MTTGNVAKYTCLTEYLRNLWTPGHWEFPMLCYFDVESTKLVTTTVNQKVTYTPLIDVYDDVDGRNTIQMMSWEYPKDDIPTVPVPEEELLMHLHAMLVDAGYERAVQHDVDSNIAFIGRSLVNRRWEADHQYIDEHLAR